MDQSNLCSLSCRVLRCVVRHTFENGVRIVTLFAPLFDMVCTLFLQCYQEWVMTVFTVLLRVGHACFYSVTKSGSYLFLQCY